MTKRDKQASEYASEELRSGAVACGDLPARLREASHFALMSAARLLVREAADEIERIRWRAKVQSNIIARLMAALEKQ